MRGEGERKGEGRRERKRGEDSKLDRGKKTSKIKRRENGEGEN